MAVYIDPPAWPAHGTSWSHLVSDESYDELHGFARSLGLSRRMFDLDHYDIPEPEYDRVVAAGATAVPSRELVRRLADAGLRVRPVDRAMEYARRRAVWLRAEWAVLGTTVGVADAVAWHELGTELLDRWSEPHRRYHDLVHLHDVLLALEQLADGGARIAPSVRLAAWFHDAVYDGRPGDDERDSADLARGRLTQARLDAALVDAVEYLVLATDPAAPDQQGVDADRQGMDHDRQGLHGDRPGVGEDLQRVHGNRAGVGEDPQRVHGNRAGVGEDRQRVHGDRAGAGEGRQGIDADEAMLLDADLAILAAGSKRYRDYTDAVRTEYAHVPDAQFREGRARIMQAYLDRPFIYRTPIARERWEARARFNLTAEVAELRGGTGQA